MIMAPWTVESKVMEPGFLHLGWREFAAVLIAVAIISDWAATRYLRSPHRTP